MVPKGHDTFTIWGKRPAFPLKMFSFFGNADMMYFIQWYGFLDITHFWAILEEFWYKDLLMFEA